MEELCQPSLNSRGEPISLIAIQATKFGLKNDMIQQVQNSCQFHGLPDDDANKHLNKFFHVTQSFKVNGVTDDALRLYLFPHSLTHYAIAWKYFPPSMVMKLINEITNFRQRPNESLFEAWEHYKLSVDRCPNHNMLPATQIDTFYNGLTLRHRDTINAATVGTFMKRHPEECYYLIKNMTTHHNDWNTLAQRTIVGQTQNVYAARAYQGLGTLPGNTITNPKEELKGITTRSGTAYQGPTIPTTSSSLPPVVELWNKLSLPELSPTYMTLKLADRSISRPVEVAEDVIVKVWTFHFLADFVVVDFDADPRVSLILKRSFLKTRRALILVFEGELTLQIGKEAITFNLDQTLRYSTNYNDITANRIDVIDMACEEYLQEVLGFSDVIASGNPTPYYDSIVSTFSPTLTPFRESDFILEEVDAFLSLEDDPTSPEVDQSVRKKCSKAFPLLVMLSIDQCPNHNMLPVTQIDTFYNGLTLRHHDTINAAARGTFMKRRPEECYDLIKNMTAHHNDWDTSAQRSESSSSITSSSDMEIAALKAE
uniref:Reverse transcriptase domain-containing protein n=1 Tax=Tanacetum cinerariifolium TaxID=118510 RepID=A0A699I9R0_TANCI|nr:reverse transcriptase domain-containing protein [Tanacetum cinerariifolium]